MDGTDLFRRSRRPLDGRWMGVCYQGRSGDRMVSRGAEREELEVQDAGLALDGMFAALRAQSRKVGMPIASITINYVGPHGGRRPKRNNLPPE